MREIRYERLRPAQIVAEMRECPVAFVPVGPLEWHGPHLPLGTDALIAEGVARRVCEWTGGLVLPTLFFGTERERAPKELRFIGFQGDEYIIGMDFPANILRSLYVREEYLAMAVREILEQVVRQGWKLIVILNGHGATNQIQTLTRLALEFSGERNVRAVVFSAWESSGPPTDPGHAGADETSQMMALYPESVDLSALPPLPEPLRNVDWAVVDGPTFDGHPSPDFTCRDDPRQAASAEIGERSVSAAVDFISGQVSNLLAALR